VIAAVLAVTIRIARHRSRMVKDVGLTRAAGIVCPGDRALTTTSVLAATVED
jgi:hypothetical protein